MRGRTRETKSETGSRRIRVRWETRDVTWRPCICPSRVGGMAGFGENTVCAEARLNIAIFSAVRAFSPAVPPSIAAR
jgi:hypothetical protein